MNSDSACDILVASKNPEFVNELRGSFAARIENQRNIR